MLNRLKRRLDDAVAWRVNQKIVGSLDELLAERDLDLDSVARRRADYEARLAGLVADYSFLRSEFDRLAPQLAALEYRFERLQSRMDLPETDHDSLLEQARLEHERARIRLELASHYEERLRRLEISERA